MRPKYDIDYINNKIYILHDDLTLLNEELEFWKNAEKSNRTDICLMPFGNFYDCKYESNDQDIVARKYIITINFKRCKSIQLKEEEF